MQAHLDVLDGLGMRGKGTFVDLGHGSTRSPQDGEHRLKELCRVLPAPGPFRFIKLYCTTGKFFKM